MFAANQLSNGKRKHTVINAEKTGWFVWNMATYNLRNVVNLSAIEWPTEEDELAKARVTPVTSINAPWPRVKESPTHFECRHLSTGRFRGHSNHGWVDIAQIRPLARLGYYDYTSTDVFEIFFPTASDMALAGLEGKKSKVD